jgi:amino acid adenylation domain-containing protein
VSALLQDRVTAAARRHATRTALVLGDQRMTYAELEAASNRLARLLVDQGVRPGDRVCLVQPKAPAAIVSMLATLKAGAVYVPLDPDSPAARARLVLEAADPALVLAAAAAQPLLDGMATTAPVGCVDGRLGGARFGAGDEAGYSAEPLPGTTRPEDPAHLLFTSGSTGIPKGVVITHAMVDAFLNWALPYFGTMPGDRISGHPPLHFDLSTFDIYGTLSAGAELHLVPPGFALPAQLAAFIRDSELTQWFSVPSTFALMARFNLPADHDFPALERIIWCGEVLPTPVLAHWMRRVPHPSYTNLYGPTEATIASSYHTVHEIPADESEPIPIGRACAGEDLVVLDEERRPVAPGEIGEVCIAGAGLSPGYWRDEAKTSAAFVRDRDGRRVYRTGDLGRTDEDGVLHFLGRLDSQIKSRGYRIELGEIESALATVPGVAESAVVGLPTDGFEGTAICCAFAARPGAQLTPAGLRTVLAASLPSYMLPSRWLELADLPKNVNGKVDRRALRERFATTLAHV